MTVPGHMQRGGTPCAYDRVLSSRLGTTAALMISKGEYGNMVAIHDHVITSVPQQAGLRDDVGLGVDGLELARHLLQGDGGDHVVVDGHHVAELALGEVAEGAMSKKEAAMSKKEYKKHLAELLEAVFWLPLPPSTTRQSSRRRR